MNKWVQSAILVWLLIQFFVALDGGLHWAISWVAINVIVIGIVVFTFLGARAAYRKVRT